MKPPQYSVDGYLVRLCMTSNRVLLVEGKSEKRAFNRILEVLSPSTQDHLPSIVVDTAEIIQSPDSGTLGNREKVELVCKKVMSNRLLQPGRLVGFVDREFRCFDCDGKSIADHLRTHRVDDLLVWSRGHSLENYFFDCRIWRGAIYCFVYGDPDDLQAALTAFENAFPSILQVACCVSLAARDANRLNAVAGHVDWTALSLDSGVMTIDMSTWRNHLLRNAKFDQGTVQELLGRYEYWEPIVKASDEDAVRWACHGHVSESIIWASFVRCVHETCGRDPQKVQQAMSSGDRTRMCACIEYWVNNIHEGSYVYPEPVMQMLRTIAPQDERVANL